MTHVGELAPSCDPRDDGCHLCGDVAVAARVVDVCSATMSAVVVLGDARVTIALDLVDAQVGDLVMVHLGFAIQRLEHT